MAEYTCPDCHKVVKDLKKHMQRIHKKPDAKETESNMTPAAESTESDENMENFEIVPPKKTNDKESAKYHCVDCGAELTKNQTPCPGCGAGLDWGTL